MIAALALAAAVTSPLPPGWHADSGTPVAWGDTTVWLYDDTFDRMGPDMMPAPDAEIHRNALVVDDTWIVDPLPQLPNGGYWWQDGVELPDGSLLVLLTEFENHWELEPPMQFIPVDTDAMIVRDPTSEWSWAYAREHGFIDDGPWEDNSVAFIDGTDLAVARDPWNAVFDIFTTYLYRYDPADPTASWVRLPSNLPDSGAVFVPVQTATGWYGLSWGLVDDWHTVTLWTTPADRLGTDTPWTEVWTERTDLETHYHTLVVVDGQVLWRSNNLDGSRRPEYEEIT